MRWDDTKAVMVRLPTAARLIVKPKIDTTLGLTIPPWRIHRAGKAGQ